MTLEEIARELGYSKSTVSRALSGKGRISKETVEEVQNFVYRQEEGGKAEEESHKRTYNIGVLLPSERLGEGGIYFQNCLLGICEAASTFGYNVLLTTEKPHDLSSIRAMVEEKRVDGIIITRSLEDDHVLQYLTKVNFPTAVTGSCSYEKVIQVDTDNEEASEKMTAMLIGKGFRKFALLVKDMNYIVDRNRHEGFLKALYQRGIPEENQVVYKQAVKMAYIESIIGELMVQKVECVICGDDEICTKFMSRLQAEGYRIPRDIAVASLYNSPNLECFSPAVTSVNVAASQMGNMAGKQLIQSIIGGTYQKKTLIDYDIIFRKSTN